MMTLFIRPTSNIVEKFRKTQKVGWYALSFDSGTNKFIPSEIPSLTEK